MFVLSVIEPEAPVTVMVAVEGRASKEAMSHRIDVALSFALGVTRCLENVAVTPLGSPAAPSLTAELKPSTLVTMILLVIILPWIAVRAASEAPMVKVFGAGLTIKRRMVVAVRPPEVPVMVTVAVPAVAEPLAISVSTPVSVVGFVLNDAVTPFGRPDTAKFTLPANPPASVTVMVVAPEPPWVMLRLLGEAESV